MEPLVDPFVTNLALDTLDDALDALVYNSEIDCSSIRNVMLIDSSILESQLFYDSINTNTFSIKYSYSSQKTELMELLKNKFPNGLDRISFVFHDPSVLEKAFLDNSCFFVKTDLVPDKTSFSENIAFLIDLVKEFHITHFDFLACNTLQYDNWKSFYELLARQSGVICGASNDKTGNLMSGSNWLMENTNEDIKSVYFNTNIDNYASSLSGTTISSAGGTIYIQSSVITFTPLVVQLQYSLVQSPYNWTTITSFPININNTSAGSNVMLNVVFTTNLTITGVDQYFVCASPYITFKSDNDSVNRNVNIFAVTGYPGLIQNGTSVINGYSNIIVQSINMAAAGDSTLAINGGWLCQQYFGKTATNVAITDCTNSGSITDSGAGGICGRHAGYNGSVTITNCSNSGPIAGFGAGGICGAYAAYSRGSVTITGCSNSGGTISGENAGGIFGQIAGYYYGTIIVSNCFNNMNITGYAAGGIFGAYAGYDHSSISITKSYNTGSVAGDLAGGIVGLSAAGIYGSVSITNCYNTGLISGSQTGGIVGSQAGEEGGAITINKCYNVGNITGSLCGGIVGAYFAYDTSSVCSITNSYNVGSVGGLNSGGICGASPGYNDDFYPGENYPPTTFYPVINITNCYNTNAIALTCGGIFGGVDIPYGDYQPKPVITLTNSYSAGDYTDPNSGLVAVSLEEALVITIDDCYVTNGTWSDSAANYALTGTPANPGIGIVWTSLASSMFNFYLLTAFDNELYDPNGYTLAGDQTAYTTDAGIQSSSAYEIIENTISVGSGSPTISMDSDDGRIYYSDVSEPVVNIQTDVVAYPNGSTNINLHGYNINHFTLTKGAIPVPSGDTLYFRQDESGQLQYSRTPDNPSSWTDAIYPIHVINSGLTRSRLMNRSRDVIINASIVFTDNLNITNADYYFVCDSSYITFEGNNNSFTIDGVTTGYPGFIQNGTNLNNGFHTINVQNFVTDAINSSVIAVEGGWLCQAYFGANTNNIIDAGPITITNCVNNGIINNDFSGGILGARAGLNGHTDLINCSNTASIISAYAGGILGTYAGFTSGLVTITNCNNAGSISGFSAGGICGAFAASYSGEMHITSCYNSGLINDIESGGICGSSAASDSGDMHITSCYNAGLISGSKSGGICGSKVGAFNGSVTITKCYNISDITGEYAGGIAGDWFGYNTNNVCSISDSYNIGSIGGTSSGGICGAEVGFENSVYSPIVNITRCYALGAIATSCGGILGGTEESSSYSYPATITLTNCYSAGSVTDDGSGLVALSLQIPVTTTNCYIANGVWSDSNANALLTGIPTNPGVGVSWASLGSNTPYLLTAFNDALYNPNSITTLTNTFATTEGLQASSIYAIINNEQTSSTHAIIVINSDDGIIQYSQLTNNVTIKTNVVAYNPVSEGIYYYGYNINSFTITYGICFKEDTKILCFINDEEIYMPIQNIRPGTLVKTYGEKEKDKYVAVDQIGWFSLYNSGDNIRTEDGLYELTETNYPELTEPLVLTGRHSILVDYVDRSEITNVKALKTITKIHDKYKLPCFVNNKANVYLEKGLFRIWTFCLKTYNDTKNFGVYANGLLVETICKKRMNMRDLTLVK